MTRAMASGLLIVLAWCLWVPIHASELQLVGDRVVQSFTAKDKTVHQLWRQFHESLGLLISTETWREPAQEQLASDCPDPRSAKASLDLRSTTVREILAALVKLDGDRQTWIETDQWINVVPKAQKDAPDYWLNRRVAGTVRVSAASLVSEPPSALADAIRDVRMLPMAVTAVLTRAQAEAFVRGQPPPPDRLGPLAAKHRTGELLLDHPTVREVYNARAYMLGQIGWRTETRPDYQPRTTHRFTASFSWIRPPRGRTCSPPGN